MGTVMTWCAGAIGLQVSVKNDWKPGKDTSEDAFKESTAYLHRALKPILWEVCSDTYTMFKIEHSDHGNGLRDFKWKWRYDSEYKREEDAKEKSCSQMRCRRWRSRIAGEETKESQTPEETV